MSLFIPDPNEKLILTVNASWFQNKMMMFRGEFHITDRRVAFEKYPNPEANGLLLKLVKSYRARIVADIPVKDIKRVYLQKFGLGKKMVIEYGDQSIAFLHEENNRLLTLLPNVEDEVIG